jgi:hypothetical protein
MELILHIMVDMMTWQQKYDKKFTICILFLFFSPFFSPFRKKTLYLLHNKAILEECLILKHKRKGVIWSFVFQANGGYE